LCIEEEEKMSKFKFFWIGVLFCCLFYSCVSDSSGNYQNSFPDDEQDDTMLPSNDDGETDDNKDDENDPDNDVSENDTEFLDVEYHDEIPDNFEGNDDETTDDENPLPICADLCRAGEISEKGKCALWDDKNGTWLDQIEDGDGNMHNRARNYISFLREKLMPHGGVFRTLFSDSTYEVPTMHGGKRDSPIWTGTYLASEAFRYMVTKAPDALEQIEKTIRVLDLWWNISGGRGYLARYAVPVNGTDQVVLDMFSESEPEDTLNYMYNGELWHWKGDISRDQYQGVMFGFSLAYDALEDEELKEIIRSNIVNTVEQLMEKKIRKINVVIDGAPAVPVNLELEYVIPQKDSEIPRFEINTGPFEMVDATILYFWPNPPEYLRQIPGLGWLPDVPLRSQAIQLASFFEIALHVTKDVPEYAARREAIFSHFAGRFQEWRNMGAAWENSNKCGDSYHGLNIAFLPAFNWVRLEEDYFRKTDLQNFVLRDRMWEAVKDHKNVFFSYIYTSQANPTDNIAPVISAQTDQLRQFPPAPYLAIAVDNTGKYEENPECPGLSKTAIDVSERVPASFLWERNPWKLKEDAVPNYIYPGVDYLITYWMARYYGYLEEDAPDTCLRWKE
jgi:hypothetical protein